LFFNQCALSIGNNSEIADLIKEVQTPFIGIKKEKSKALEIRKLKQ